MAGQNTGLKLLVVLLVVISLALGGAGYILLKQEKERSAQLESELNDTKGKYRQAQAEIEQQNIKIAGLSSSLDNANLEIRKLNTKVSEEQQARQEALSKLEALTADLKKQSNIAGDLQKKLSESQSALQEADKRLKEMESQLKTAEAKKSELEKKVKSLEEKAANVELGKIVVSPEPAAKKKAEPPKEPAKKLEGKVLVVNKDYRFAVINLGSKDGASVGAVFSVVHNGKNIGDVKVEKVHDTMSAAGFVTPELKDKILEGDSVIQK